MKESGTVEANDKIFIILLGVETTDANKGIAVRSNPNIQKMNFFPTALSYSSMVGGSSM